MGFQFSENGLFLSQEIYYETFLHPAWKVKNLDVRFVRTLVQLHDVGVIKQYPTVDSAVFAVHFIVSSCLDLCSPPFNSLSIFNANFIASKILLHKLSPTMISTLGQPES